MKPLFPVAALITVVTLLASCGKSETDAPELTPSQAATALFDKLYMEQVRLSPVQLTQLGIKEQYGLWDDLSKDAANKKNGLLIQQLEHLNQLDAATLDNQTQLSLRLFKQQLRDEIAAFKWRLHNYPLNQMYGWHTTVPDVLINQHQISSVEDAKAYISRLGRIQTLFDQVVQQLRARAAMHIMPPRFVLEQVVDASRNIITGAPFDQGPDSPLLADFGKKVNALDISSTAKDKLLNEATTTLENVTFNAYSKLIAFMTALQKSADNRAGVWKFPDGDNYYAYALQHHTTTDLSANEIHQLGLDQVKRIHSEMNAIRKKVGFEGDLQAFFEFFRTDPRFTYPDTEVGRAEYLAKNKAVIAQIKTRLPELFGILPKADLIVKAVEPYREKTAGTAFYDRPALDGSRPGIYYANLYSMADMPGYQIEALAYHEGAPGHHMQIAIAQELQGLPMFRKLGGHTAYIEGWGLYAEQVPKELGLYQDPWSDFGRLALELWRAGRLVADTGLHSKRWTREQTIAWLQENTPETIGKITKQVERYIVLPGQATSYMIGKLKILELREKARRELGDKFDIRAYHDLVLGSGSLPLTVLEEQVEHWITRTNSE